MDADATSIQCTTFSAHKMEKEQCSTNLHCEKKKCPYMHFAFSYDPQVTPDRNHATRAVNLCASIIMCKELTRVRRTDHSTDVVNARPRPGYEGGAHRVTCAQRDEHVALPTEMPPPPRIGNSDEFRPCSKMSLNSSKYR